MDNINNQSSVPNILHINDVMNVSANEVLTIIFCFSLIIIAIKLTDIASLLSNVIFLSVFSSLISCIYLLMDAPDVAMTEVALGACLSTCVFLSFLKTIDYTYCKDKNITQEIKSWKNFYAAAFCIVFVIIMVLLNLELPRHGAIDSPVQTNLTRYYIDNTHREIGISSMVASVLASYRGFDTLGETSVILIGGIGISLLLPDTEKTQTNLEKYLILKRASGFIFSFIILYSLFVQLNGETSPGGGFQAGVIFASGFICYNLIYGDIEKYLTIKILTITSALGVMIYASVGVFSLFFNDNYLNYYSLSLYGINGQQLAIFIVEIGVGFTVASVMCLIYSLFEKI